MEMVGVGSDVDRISYFPSNVINNILAWLPLKDAVRTSTLSKMWIEKWHSVPQIAVDENFFDEISQRKLEGLINYILTRHEGKMEKFSVSVGKVRDCYNIKLWIWRLSQKSIQELTLLICRGHWPKVPSVLFSCQHLRKLNLSHFVVELAHSFKGFHDLTSLQLNKIKIATVAFERLISNCRSLQHLTVRKLSCINHLHIIVPSLRYFSFDGEFKSIRFETPLLEVLSVNLYRIGSENNQFDLRFKFCRFPSSIKELYLRCKFQKFLAAGDTFTEITTSYNHLRTLVLDSFCFEKLDEVHSLLSLIRSSFNLEILEINACNCENEQVPELVLRFWETQNDFSLFSSQLKKATVNSFHGTDHELMFVQFMLAKSPLLEEMTVECQMMHDFDWDAVKAKLLSSCPSSTKLKFVGGDTDSSDSDDSWIGSSSCDSD